MREASHAKPRVLEPVEIGTLPFDVSQAFHREHRARDRLSAATAGKQNCQIALHPDCTQMPVRPRGTTVELGCMPQRAFDQRCPGPQRLGLCDGEPGNVVGVRAIGDIVLPLGRLGYGRQDLQRDLAIGESRQVDLPPSAACQQVAFLHQRVGMHVGNLQRLVECRGAGGYLRRWRAGDAVHRSLDDGREDAEEDDRSDAGERREPSE